MHINPASRPITAGYRHQIPRDQKLNLKLKLKLKDVTLDLKMNQYLSLEATIIKVAVIYRQP